MEERPKFLVRRSATAPLGPEQLFSQLERAKTHGYLRGEQQDILRQYANEAKDEPNVSLELPTGTGKTAVGLLIAEWRRQRSNSPAAFLSVTNQLAHQVMAEAEKLGIDYADLTGGRAQRKAESEGRYRTGQAIGITTYSNLFNSRPVIGPSDVLVFDDVHGGEHYVADMWTVRISSEEDDTLYQRVFEVLRPILMSSQIQGLNDRNSYSVVHLADLELVRGLHADLTALLDASDLDNVKFAWRLIRSKLGACLTLLSSNSIILRPLIPPTQTHPSFSESQQRIYMSATLGNEGDLQRAFGVRSIKLLRAPNAQWGRRYILVPEMYASPDETSEALGRVWDSLDPKRAVLLAPSNRILDTTFDEIDKASSTDIIRFSASDIVDSLDTFTQSEDAILAVAGRYDGLDLPDDDCRLLLMSESPGAIGELERHLRDQWKLGPALQRKERVRLIQGLGRCTRSATDFAIVFWLGQSLVDAATNQALLAEFPLELRAELAWGLEQSQMAGDSIEDFAKLALGLLENAQYRAEANRQITALLPGVASPAVVIDGTGDLEVRFSAQVWEEDYEGAYRTAREIADQVVDQSLTGLRAWWWYLASCMARRIGDGPGEIDCLNRAYACVVNTGWLRAVAKMRGQEVPVVPEGEATNVEKLWENLARLGFAGPNFEKKMSEMINLLNETEHSKFHQGLEFLGAALGAAPTRSNEQGAPDVVWSFSEEVVTFEAKTEKKFTAELSKADLQEANGHVNWVKERLNSEASLILPIIVSPTTKIHDAGRPHVESLMYVSPDDVRTLAGEVRVFLQSARAKYAGKSFAEIQSAMAADVKQSQLDVTSLLGRLRATPLSKLL